MKYTEKLAKLCWGCLGVVLPLSIAFGGCIGYTVVSIRLGEPHPILTGNQQTDKSMVIGLIVWAIAMLIAWKVRRYFKTGNSDNEEYDGDDSADWWKR